MMREMIPGAAGGSCPRPGPARPPVALLALARALLARLGEEAAAVGVLARGVVDEGQDRERRVDGGQRDRARDACRDRSLVQMDLRVPQRAPEVDRGPQGKERRVLRER